MGSTIIFADGIYGKEQYPEPGMKAFLRNACKIGIERPGDTFVVRLEVDFSLFESHNRLLESDLYENPNGEFLAPVNARAAGQYKPTQYLYFDEYETVSDFFN